MRTNQLIAAVSAGLLLLAACGQVPAPVPTEIPTWELILPPKWTDTATPAATIPPIDVQAADPSIEEDAETSVPTATPTPMPVHTEIVKGLTVQPAEDYAPGMQNSLWTLVGEFTELAKPGAQQYYVTIGVDQIWQWDISLCAADVEEFSALQDAVTMTFQINSNWLSGKALLVKDYQGENGSCRAWATLLSGWTPRNYTLDIVYVLSRDVPAGERTLLQGDYTQTIFVTAQ